MEGVIVGLFVIGLWIGRRERLLWMVLLPMLFDAIIHLGFRFAATDVYIMTAHWAFIIPIAIAYIIKQLQAAASPNRKRAKGLLISLIVVTTLYLWVHNTTLLVGYMWN